MTLFYLRHEVLTPQAMRKIQQRVTLRLTADLIGRAAGRSISMEEAEGWTVYDFAEKQYQVFIALQGLLQGPVCYLSLVINSYWYSSRFNVWHK